MTISNQTSSVTHNGNGLTTEWPFTFEIPTGALKVGLFDIATNALTELVDTDYSVLGLDDPDGGEVTYPLVGPPISDTKRLVIWREVALTQDMDVTNQSPYYPEVLEDQLDRIVMMVQQLQGDSDRSIKVTLGSNLTPDEFVETLLEGAAEAEASALAAAASAAAALTSEGAANASAGVSTAAAASAEASASTASSAAVAAEASASEASTQASAAAASESVSTAAAVAAEASETNAVAAAATATTKAGEASADAASASASAAAASSSAAAAAASAADAAASAGSLDVANLRWLAKGIGELYAVDTSIAGVEIPPTDNSGFRYIKLTASDAYNTGVLTSESVSGSAPNITATAVVSLSGSPINGQTVALINTDRRFIRAGSAGTKEQSQNLSHIHTGSTDSQGSHGHTGVTDSQGAHTHSAAAVGVNTTTAPGGILAGAVAGSTGSAGAHTHNLSINANGAHTHTVTIAANGDVEARPANIGVTYYMRIK